MQNSRTLHFRITCLSAMTLMMRRDTSLLARAIDKVRSLYSHVTMQYLYAI